MKKLILIIIVVGALLIPPFFIGSQIETIFRDQINKSNTSPAYQLEVTDYQKGWFTSSAKVTVSIELPTKLNNHAEPQLTYFIINQNMQHGPVLWKVDGLSLGLVDAIIDFQLPEELQSELDKIEQINEDTLSITSRTNFDLSSKTKLTLKPFSINKNNAEMSIKGANGSFAYNMEGHVKGDFKWEGMNIKKDVNQSVDIGTTSLSLDQQLVIGEMFSPTAIFSGDATIELSHLKLNEHDSNKNLDMQGLAIVTKSDINDQVSNISFTLNAKSIESGAIQQKFNNLIYDISFENLSTQVLQEINKQLIEIQINNQPPMQAIAQIQGLLPKLIAQGPVLKINKLGVITEAGEIDSHFRLAFDQKIYDAANPMTMMLAIDAKANGYAPEAFFASFGLSEKVEQMVQQNFLVRDKTNLTFKFSFKNGQPLLNDSPIPLGGF